MRGRPADQYAYFDAPFIALAHRGGITDEAPIEVENSLRGFRAAWDFGFRYLETDVHTTADGVLVAFHDEVLDRVTDAAGRSASAARTRRSTARSASSDSGPLTSTTRPKRGWSFTRSILPARTDIPPATPSPGPGAR